MESKRLHNSLQHENHHVWPRGTVFSFLVMHGYLQRGKKEGEKSTFSGLLYSTLLKLKLAEFIG